MSDEPGSDDGSAYDSDDGRLSTPETQDLCNIAYSREATITAFFSYFEFLTTMFMDPELVQMPPEGGWPEISVESMRDLGKTDEVVELLRRLPYTRSPSGDEGKGDGGGFALTDWTKIARDLSRESRPLSSATLDYYRNRTEGSYDHIPPHVVGLVSRATFDMFLDTQLGVVYFPGDVYVPSPTIRAQQADAPFRPVADDAEDYAVVEEADGWRSGRQGLKCAWAIPDFFEMMKHHFRELNYLPLNRDWVADAFWGDEEATLQYDDPQVCCPIAKKIFREHGWPDTAIYQKSKCMSALESQWEAFQQGARIG